VHKVEYSCGPKEPCIRLGSRLPHAKGQCLGERKVIAWRYARRNSAMSWAKMTEPIKVLFGLWTRVGPRKYVLGGMHTGATCRQIPLNHPCVLAMRPFCQITLTTCFQIQINADLKCSWNCYNVQTPLAVELALPYATIALVTDYDCWRDDELQVYCSCSYTCQF